jgi:hypothetical protein
LRKTLIPLVLAPLREQVQASLSRRPNRAAGGEFVFPPEALTHDRHLAYKAAVSLVGGLATGVMTSVKSGIGCCCCFGKGATRFEITNPGANMNYPSP